MHAHSLVCARFAQPLSFLLRLARSARGAAQHSFLLGLCPKVQNEWNKWKNHFHEMNGDVGMSSNEKEREQEDAYTKTESHS